jgi:hypothetical protein
MCGAQFEFGSPRLATMTGWDLQLNTSEHWRPRQRRSKSNPTAARGNLSRALSSNREAVPALQDTLHEQARIGLSVGDEMQLGTRRKSGEAFGYLVDRFSPMHAFTLSNTTIATLFRSLLTQPVSLRRHPDRRAVQGKSQRVENLQSMSATSARPDGTETFRIFVVS